MPTLSVLFFFLPTHKNFVIKKDIKKIKMKDTLTAYPQWHICFCPSPASLPFGKIKRAIFGLTLINKYFK